MIEKHAMDRTAPWPLWRKVLAYAVLSALAVGSIWLVDRKVTRLHDVRQVTPR